MSFTATTAVLLARGGTEASASSRWARRSWPPDAYVRLRHAMQPKDWLAGQLTGRIVTEPSGASGTWLFDVAAGSWPPLILDRLNIGPAIFAAPEPSFSVVGNVLPAVPGPT
jgi:xylulokinase